MKIICPMLLTLACILAGCKKDRPPNNRPFDTETDASAAPDDAGLGGDAALPTCHTKDGSLLPPCSDRCGMCPDVKRADTASGTQCCKTTYDKYGTPPGGLCQYCGRDPDALRADSGKEPP
jgi:hypothetical protein